MKVREPSQAFHAKLLLGLKGRLKRIEAKRHRITFSSTIGNIVSLYELYSVQLVSKNFEHILKVVVVVLPCSLNSNIGQKKQIERTKVTA